MRHAPYESEYQAVQTMSDAELLEYFLIRIAESDEVWGLNKKSALFSRELNGKNTVPVWAYLKYAREAALDYWQDCVPNAMSLEYFVFQTLQQLIEQDVLVEVMPNAEKSGCVITPHRLMDILVGIMHTREYRLDADG